MGAMVPLIQTGTTEYLAGSSAGSAAPVFLDATHSLTNAGTITAYLPTAVPGARYIINTPNTALCYLTRTGTDTFYGYTAGAPSDTVIQINSYYPWVRVECYVAGKWHIFFPEINFGMGPFAGVATGVCAETTLATINLPPYLDGSTYRHMRIYCSWVHGGGAVGAKTSRIRLNGTQLAVNLMNNPLYPASFQWVDVYFISGASQSILNQRNYGTGAVAPAWINAISAGAIDTNVAANIITFTGESTAAGETVELSLTYVTLDYANSGYGC